MARAWEPRTEELVTRQAENRNFCHCRGWNFADCTAAAQRLFCQAVCLQRRIKHREVVRATPGRRKNLMDVRLSLES